LFALNGFFLQVQNLISFSEVSFRAF